MDRSRSSRSCRPCMADATPAWDAAHQGRVIIPGQTATGLSWVARAPKRDLCLHRGSMLVGGHLAGDVVGRRPDLNDVTKVEVGHAAEEVSDRTGDGR